MAMFRRKAIDDAQIRASHAEKQTLNIGENIACIYAHNAYNNSRGDIVDFREVEKIILDDGWNFIGAKGSHYQYRHDKKPGKVTIPNHKGDLNIKTINSILKQAGLR
jgi:predicted RNA binding protein YcfA (HicA-like mRNA interferase family)